MAQKLRAMDGDGKGRETGPNATVHEYLEQPYRDYVGKAAGGLLPGIVLEFQHDFSANFFRETPAHDTLVWPILP